MLNTLYNAIEKIARTLALLGLVGLLFLSIMVVADIILRWLIGFPLKGVNDVYAVVIAVVIAACIPNALLAKQNISIEVVGEAFGGRIRALLESFAAFAVLIFFAILAWKFIPYSAAITASGEQTWVLKLPVGPWWWTATALFWVAVATQAMVLLSDLCRVIWPNHPGLGGTGLHATEQTDGSF